MLLFCCSVSFSLNDDNLLQDCGHSGYLPTKPSCTLVTQRDLPVCCSGLDSDVIVQMCSGHGSVLLRAHWLEPVNPLCVFSSSDQHYSLSSSSSKAAKASQMINNYISVKRPIQKNDSKII